MSSLFASLPRKKIPQQSLHSPATKQPQENSPATATTKQTSLKRTRSSNGQDQTNAHSLLTFGFSKSASPPAADAHATAAAAAAADAAAMPPPSSLHVPQMRTAVQVNKVITPNSVRKSVQPQLHSFLQPPPVAALQETAPVLVAAASSADVQTAAVQPQGEQGQPVQQRFHVSSYIDQPVRVNAESALAEPDMAAAAPAAASPEASPRDQSTRTERDSEMSDAFVSPLPSPTCVREGRLHCLAAISSGFTQRPSSRTSPSAATATAGAAVAAAAPYSPLPGLSYGASPPRASHHNRSSSVGGSFSAQLHRRSASLTGTPPIDVRYLARLQFPASPARSPLHPPRARAGGHGRSLWSLGLTADLCASPAPRAPISSVSSVSSTASPLCVTPSSRALQETARELDVSDRFIPCRRGSNLEQGIGLLAPEERAMQENVVPAQGGSQASQAAVAAAAAAIAASTPGRVTGVVGARASDPSSAGGSSPAVPSFSPVYSLLLRSEIFGSKDGGLGGSSHSTASLNALASVEPMPLNSQLVLHRTGSTTDARQATSLVAGVPSTPATSAAVPAPSASAASATAASPSSASGLPADSLLTHSPLYRFSSPRHGPATSSAWWMNPSAVTPETQRLVSRLRAPPRAISEIPFKVLDAPGIRDDYYLNLLDWSSTNVVAVALGAKVYLWHGATSNVSQLLDLDEQVEQVTSIAFTMRGAHLAVGTRSGTIQFWDIAKQKCVRTLSGHCNRVGSLAWNSHVLASGSRDRSVLLHDPRAVSVGSGATNGSVVSQLLCHKQEVCGLKWSPDEQQLATGGNDNKLLVWSATANATPLHRFEQHTAAVKAIAWSPHQHGLLCSGGGTADRSIRFWSTIGVGSALSHIDTGSQVCSLLWSRNCNEIVSAHGYSLNQIVAWNYPSMQPIATLCGHSSRVLYLAVSPCGQTILTGAADETLRFWNLFPSSDSNITAAMHSAPLKLPTHPGSLIR